MIFPYCCTARRVDLTHPGGPGIVSGVKFSNFIELEMETEAKLLDGNQEIKVMILPVIIPLPSSLSDDIR